MKETNETKISHVALVDHGKGFISHWICMFIWFLIAGPIHLLLYLQDLYINYSTFRFWMLHL